MEKINFIDTTNEENMKRYIEKLKELIIKTKTEKKINNFVTIRSDDFLPSDFVWRANGEDLDGVYNMLCIYRKKQETKKSGLFKFLSKSKNVDTTIPETTKFELYSSVKFRSTKHFTINTPLGLTSEYNTVKLDRDFTVIDGIGNFINSGYAYSVSERDAYLDVTHEGLKISDNAIVLISNEKYEQIKDNKEIMETLGKRTLVIYKGDPSAAINMVLAENGILPFRNGIFEYDEEIKSIIQESFNKLCNDYNVKYNVSHGYGGHFTSLIDQYGINDNDLKNFIEYLNNIFPNIKIEYDDVKTKGASFWNEYIDIIGYDAFKNTLNAYNNQKKQIIKNKKQSYINERDSITPEISNIFKNAIDLIKRYEEIIPFQNPQDPLTQKIVNFYISQDIRVQVDCALNIISLLQEYENENNRVK